MNVRILMTIIPIMHFLSCSTNRFFQTECAGLSNSGYIDVFVWNTKKGVLYTIDEARKDAIYAALYTGVASGKSCVSQPAILRNEEERKNFERISKDFFSKSGHWTRFTANAQVSNITPSSSNDNSTRVYNVSVAKSDLRKYLEEHKIIKSLNNGF